MCARAPSGRRARRCQGRDRDGGRRDHAARRHAIHGDRRSGPSGRGGARLAGVTACIHASRWWSASCSPCSPARTATSRAAPRRLAASRMAARTSQQPSRAAAGACVAAGLDRALLARRAPAAGGAVHDRLRLLRSAGLYAGAHAHGEPPARWRGAPSPAATQPHSRACAQERKRDISYVKPFLSVVTVRSARTALSSAVAVRPADPCPGAQVSKCLLLVVGSFFARDNPRSTAVASAVIMVHRGFARAPPPQPS
jgi:hypothetical protein